MTRIDIKQQVYLLPLTSIIKTEILLFKKTRNNILPPLNPFFSLPRTYTRKSMPFNNFYLTKYRVINNDCNSFFEMWRIHFSNLRREELPLTDRRPYTE